MLIHSFWQEGYSIAEGLDFSRVLDHDTAEERPYKTRKSESGLEQSVDLADQLEFFRLEQYKMVPLRSCLHIKSFCG